ERVGVMEDDFGQFATLRGGQNGEYIGPWQAGPHPAEMRSSGDRHKVWPAAGPDEAAEASPAYKTIWPDVHRRRPSGYPFLRRIGEVDCAAKIARRPRGSDQDRPARCAAG